MGTRGFRRDPVALDRRLGQLPPATYVEQAELPDALAAEAIERVDTTEVYVHFGPARGIINAVAIGAGAWTIILAAVALARAIFFG
jgi:hypothetical protein